MYYRVRSTCSKIRQSFYYVYGYGSNKGLNEFIRVGTMAIKDAYIKVRVSKEQKKLFKKVAELKGITMIELLVGGTEERVLRELDKIEGTKSLEIRVSELEKKLQEIRVKMEGKDPRRKFFIL